MKKNDILPPRFFEREDVVAIARDLLGKVLITRLNGIYTSGIIVETEAYAGISDKASHAYGGRRTARTEVMYAPAGTAYIYLCYGIHHLFNIVTNRQEIPHAVLIRALEPLEGIEDMMLRREKTVSDYSLTKGPGSLSMALGIHKSQTATILHPEQGIWVEDRGFSVADSEIASGPRIGVDYAGPDALLPYRFWLKGNKYVSKA